MSGPEDSSVEIEQMKTLRQKENGTQNKMQQKQDRGSKSWGTVRANGWKYAGCITLADPEVFSSTRLHLSPSELH